MQSGFSKALFIFRRFVSDESLKRENGAGVVNNRIEAQQVMWQKEFFFL